MGNLLEPSADVIQQQTKPQYKLTKKKCPWLTDVVGFYPIISSYCLLIKVCPTDLNGFMIIIDMKTLKLLAQQKLYNYNIFASLSGEEKDLTYISQKLLIYETSDLKLIIYSIQSRHLLRTIDLKNMKRSCLAVLSDKQMIVVENQIAEGFYLVNFWDMSKQYISFCSEIKCLNVRTYKKRYILITSLEYIIIFDTKNIQWRFKVKTANGFHMIQSRLLMDDKLRIFLISKKKDEALFEVSLVFYNSKQKPIKFRFKEDIICESRAEWIGSNNVIISVKVNGKQTNEIRKRAILNIMSGTLMASFIPKGGIRCRLSQAHYVTLVQGVLSSFIFDEDY